MKPLGTVALAALVALAGFTARADPPRSDAPAPPDAEEEVVVAPATPHDEGQKVYRASECIGAVVNGVCHGSVIDTDPARPTCHGAWVAGRCTGPQY